MNKIKRTVEVDGDIIRIKFFKGLATDDAEFCQYDIHLGDDGISGNIGSSWSKRLFFAEDHDWSEYVCPDCEESEVPGRHYKHNDPGTGQFVTCDTCNEDGDVSPARDFPEYPDFK